MKINKIKFYSLLPLLLLISIVFVVGNGYGVACGSTPTNGCSIGAGDNSITFGTYYLNDTGSGAMLFSASNSKLNCNNATFIGNGSGTGLQPEFSPYSNITIIMCNFINYNTGIKFVGMGNDTILNSSVSNSFVGISLLNGLTNNYLAYNTLNNITTEAMRLDVINSKVEYNSISNSNKSVVVAGNRYNISFNYNYLTNSTVYGFIVGGDNLSFIGNQIINKNNYDYLNSNSTNGIYSTTSGRNYTIINNKINGFGIGVYLSGINQNYIANNNISNIGLWNIGLLGNNSVIELNNVYNSSWNLIYHQGYNNIIKNNYGENWNHHGIDTHNDANTSLAFNSQIYGNNLTNPDKSIYVNGDAAFYISNSQNVSVYNNYIYNVLNSNGIGIAVEGGNSSLINQIYNNTVNGTTQQCSRDSGLNNIWTSNTYQNCGLITTVIFGNYVSQTANSAKFINNIFVDGYAYYQIYSLENVNFSVSELSSIYHKITWNKNSGNATLSFNGIKNISIVNNTITILADSSLGNKSAFFTHNSTVAFNNLATATLTMPSNGALTVGLASSAGGCDYPLDNYTAIVNTTFCSGTYTCIDANSDGCIKAGANNIVISCLNTDLVADYTGIGIKSNYNGVQIKNCSIRNYYKGVSLGNSGDNNILEYLYLSNSANWGIITEYTADNLTVRYSRFLNSSIYLVDASKANISQNTIDNNCKEENGCAGACIRSDATDGANIEGNSCSNANQGIYLWDDSSNSNANILIKNNYLFNNDKAVSIVNFGIYNTDKRNLTIRDNTFRNNTANYDGYDLGIKVLSSNNLTIFNNIFYEVPTAAILIQNATDINLSGNTFDMIPLSLRSNYLATDQEEIPSPILIKATYKGWLGTSTETATDTITTVNKFTSSKIYIQNNVFDSDTIAYLGLEGATLVTHDLSNYWYTSFQAAGYLFPKREYYFSNSVTTVQNYYPFNSYYGLPSVSDRMFIGYMTGGWVHPQRKFNYSISKTSMYFANANATTPYNLTLANLTGYWDAFYSNQSSPVCDETRCGSTFNQTNDAGNRTIVFSYSSRSNPRPVKMDPTISYMSSITTTQTTISFTCTGTGSINLTNLAVIGNSIKVYKDGSVIEKIINQNNYSTNGCSEWRFEYFDENYLPTNDQNQTNPLLNIAVIQLAALISIGLLSYPFMNQIMYRKKRGLLEIDYMKITMYVVGVILAIWFIGQFVNALM